MRKYSLMLLTCAVVMAGCKSEENAITGLSENKITCNSDVYETSVNVTGSGSWVASSNVSWCGPVSKKGSGSGTQRIWVIPNINSTSREGVITFSSGSNKQSVTISQPAFTGDIDTYQYHIPVIFHVIYDDESDTLQNIKQSLLASHLDKINKYYYNSAVYGNNNPFDPDIENNINVTFEMAKYDEDGNILEERGVMRHKVNKATMDCYDFINGELDDNDTYRSWAQNVKRFLNFYIFPFDNDNEQGISNVAIMPKGYSLDSLKEEEQEYWEATKFTTPFGCCINSNFMYYDDYYEGKMFYFNFYNVVAIMAHEVGHYLGLLHSFSEVNCEVDDACSDTPISDYEAYWAEFEFGDSILRNGKIIEHLPEYVLRSNCQTGDNFYCRNIMDYIFTYRTEFTQQQRARMRKVLYYSPYVPGPKYDLVKTRSVGEAIEDSVCEAIKPPVIKCPRRPAGGKKLMPIKIGK